jgi:hypothetical protein
LAIFVSAMIGGGIIFIDDKARGPHEGLSGHVHQQTRTHHGLHPRRRTNALNGTWSKNANGPPGKRACTFKRKKGATPATFWKC